MHYTDGKTFESDPDLIMALSLLTEGWTGVDLLAAMHLIADRLSNTEHPKFEVADDDETGAIRFTCPHCGDLLEDVTGVDWLLRLFPADVDPDDSTVVVVENFREYDALGFRCPTCHGFASLPDGSGVAYI